MKKLLSALIALSTALSVQAQEQSRNYSISVFKNVKTGEESKAKARQVVGQVHQQFPGWGALTDHISGNVTHIYGKSISLPGGSAVEKATYCIDNMLNTFGVNSGDWKMVKNYPAPKSEYVVYNEALNGHDVVFSKLKFRFAANGVLTNIEMSGYGSEGLNNTPKITSAAVAANNRFTADIDGISITKTEVAKNWVWFPVPAGSKYIMHAAWPIKVTGKVRGSVPLKLSGYIDATNGNVLYRTNDVKETITLGMQGTIYQNGTVTPSTVEPLANLEIDYGFYNYYTDAAGNISFPITTGEFYLPLRGMWSVIQDYSTGSTPTYTTGVISGSGQVLYPTTAPSSDRMVNAYYHVNRVHDFMKSYFGSNFYTMDYAMPTIIDDNSGVCNAFYDGYNINFYAAGSGCNSFAMNGDIIYHEYGHGISDYFYQTYAPSPLTNGAMNEANSDIWALSITKNPVMGLGSYAVSSGGFIRRYDKLPKMYPRNLVGEPHADGEIIAGCWWDVAVNTKPDTMTKLFTEVYYATPDGPDGSEGQVYQTILVDALTADDDDNNLTNGTPNFQAIVSAFAKHGIYLFGDLDITHNEVDNQLANVSIPVSAQVSITDPTFFGGLKLNYRLRNNTWNALAMTNGGGGIYTATIPAQTKGIIDYYFSANTILSTQSGTLPEGYDNALGLASSVTIPYQFGIGMIAKDSNHFETSVVGWKLGNVTGDNASTGKWINAVPVGSYTTNGAPCQMDYDHTTGFGKCLVTGNASNPSADIGTADVDNGKTTVLTPAFDLSAYDNPVIEYYRWFSNSRGSNSGNDPWVVKLGNASGSAWYNVDSTYQDDYHWRRRIFEVKDYLNNLNDVQLKFIASDMIDNSQMNQAQSTVEAGVDDFYIYDSKGTGIKEVDASFKARIYPNPADGQVTVQMPQAAQGTITLYAINGEAVSVIAMNSAVKQYTINTAALAAGQYTVVIKTDEHTIQSQQVIVNHSK